MILKAQLYPIQNFISANAIRCQVGVSNGYTDEIDCVSTYDRCAKTTSNGAVTYSCNSANILTAGGYRDNSCTTISSTEICICSTDVCNKNSAGKCY